MAYTVNPIIIELQIMGPLPYEAIPDTVKWGPDNEATSATDAGYNEDGRMMDPKVGEDRMKKHAIVFWCRYHEFSDLHMDAVINKNFDVDSHQKDKKMKELVTMQQQWQNKLVGSGEKSLFHNLVAFHVTIHDFYANLTKLKRIHVLSRLPEGNEDISTRIRRVT